jgi:hypothetical protein
MIMFEPPEKYRMPEGVEKGEEFEEVCTFKFDDDGKMILLAVDGNTIDKDSEKERKKQKPVGAMAKVKADMAMQKEQPEEGEENE